jgi:hypothetical protein
MPKPPKHLDEALRVYFSQLGKVGGKKGGKARAQNLTGEERREIAKKAARARWGKTRAKRT